VHARRSVRPWLIYETKTTDDAAPTIEWINSETLVLGLPCGIIGHAANPDDWERSKPNERRLRVRFRYQEGCGLAVTAAVAPVE
jgi:hypothetical protein